MLIYGNRSSSMKYFGAKEFYSRILTYKLGLKMNLKIITKNHASDQEVGFLDFKAVWLHCRQRRGWNRVPLSSAPPQISTSVPHKRATPFHLPKFLSSTLKTPHFQLC